MRRTCRRDASTEISMTAETSSICVGSDENPVLVSGCAEQKPGRFARHRLAGCPMLHDRSSPTLMDQERSTANRLRSASEQWARATSWVARKATSGAWLASNASCHREAHKHHRSPGCRPGKPNSGLGVERSLPRDFENSRNAAVITAQTVWLPKSSGPVLQQPSR
jgi:hypothetical protein